MIERDSCDNCDTSIVEHSREEKSIADKSNNNTSSITQEIYQAYPLKVGKPEALRAIQRALKITDPAVLLSKTQAYTRATLGQDPKFIPNPAKWFSEERYNDAPATWKRQYSNPSKPKIESRRV